MFPQGAIPEKIGVSLVAMGALMVLLSFLQYRKTEKPITSNCYSSSSSLVLLLVGAVFTGGICLVLYLVDII
ncbi:MAG: hypothetical protein QM664_10875 [Flavihumibacter sp.]